MLSAARAYQLVTTGAELRLSASSRSVRELNTHEMLVQVQVASLNYRDLLTLHGPAGDRPRIFVQ